MSAVNPGRPAPPPPRQRVTHPRTEGVRVPTQQHFAREVDEQTRLGEVYVTALLRTQRRHALAVCLGTAILLLGSAVVARTFEHVRLWGVPLPWIGLGFAAYPLLIGLGWLTVRTAERIERDFADVVRRR